MFAPKGFTPKGKFGWYELMTSDTKAAGKFYSDVVGWTTPGRRGGARSERVAIQGNRASLICRPLP